jgi:hypothetical protein
LGIEVGRLDGMKYRGFREDMIIATSRELKFLGLAASEIRAILNLAGAKWRSVQIREGRRDEVYEERDSRVFHEATVALMKTTMAAMQQLAELGHAADGETFMLAAISIAIDGLFSRGPKTIRSWLNSGDEETRKAVLSFAMGSSIFVEPATIDILIQRIIKFRYGVIFDTGRDNCGSILGVIERIGNSGYSCLKPITDSIR